MLKTVQLLDATSTAAVTDVGKASQRVNFLSLPRRRCLSGVERPRQVNKHILRFTEIHLEKKIVQLEDTDTRMSFDVLFDAELEAEEDQSIESRFSEVIENVEEAMRRADRLQRAGISPLTPI